MALDRKNSGFKKLAAVAVLTVVVIYSYKSIRRTTSEVKPSFLKSKASDSQAMVIPVDERSNEDNVSYKKRLVEKRIKFAAKEKIGLKSISLKKSGSYLLLPFTFKPQKIWCQAGDLDTIRYATSDYNSDSLLISIEPLSGDKGGLLRTSFTNLQDGLGHVFKLPITDKEQTYGLYICSDSKKSGSCKGKKIESAEIISAEMANKKRNDTSKDYIFYFQPIIVGNGSVKTFRASDFSESYKDNVSKFLNENYAITSSEINSAWKISSVVRSVPADMHGENLVLSLPYNDPNCSAMPKRSRGK